MDLVHKVCRPTDTHEWAALVDVVLPSVKFVVALQGQPQFLFLGLDKQTVWLEVGTFDVGDVPELDETLNCGGL
jgi:hypothetical protein